MQYSSPQTAESHLSLFAIASHCQLTLFSPLCSKPCSSQHKHRVDNAFFTFYFLTWGKETTDFNIQFMESGTHFSKIQMSSVTDQGDFWHELQVPLQRQPKGLLGPPYTWHFPSFLQTESWAPSATCNTVQNPLPKAGTVPGGLKSKAIVAKTAWSQYNSTLCRSGKVRPGVISSQKIFFSPT